ncbi:hypothetical protein EVG20_g330 [Dentipellis fragilis]|uniref:RlpA-like protein double-psi beta-barrel domain-containing protein n=1 Tax=Dentipellis fragilis TaxID=205917 RepID=A0A4Y9ZDK5_9AGAM|nr:hypothetical protein EVG20_g330 [Dentipellis fragilis]
MFHYTLVLLSALVAAASVSGLVLPRKAAPPGWAYGYLEDYDTYHIRYLALDCEVQHNTTFFDQCCHPLLATETLEKNRPAQCKPSAAASSSAVAAEPTSTVTTPADDEEWCDDEDDEPESSSTPAPPPTSEAPKPESTSAAPPKVTSSTSEAPAPTTSKAPAVSSSSSKAPAPSSSSKATRTCSVVLQGTRTCSFVLQGSRSFVFEGRCRPAHQLRRATFFFQKGVAGACGIVHPDSAKIGAMDSARFSQSICGKSVLVTNKSNQKTVTITIQDECPTCNNGNSIDLSQGAFDEIADETTGIVDIEWKFL